MGRYVQKLHSGLEKVAQQFDNRTNFEKCATIKFISDEDRGLMERVGAGDVICWMLFEKACGIIAIN